jgi:hypothetical protein
MGQEDLAGCGSRSWTRSRVGTPAWHESVRRSSTSSRDVVGRNDDTDELLFYQGAVNIPWQIDV